jgi:hypothetical protein
MQQAKQRMQALSMAFPLSLDIDWSSSTCPL